MGVVAQPTEERISPLSAYEERRATAAVRSAVYLCASTFDRTLVHTRARIPCLPSPK
jgi:hypothetical protein